MNTPSIEVLIEKLKSLPPGLRAQVENFVDFLQTRETNHHLVRAAARASESAFKAAWENDPNHAEDEIQHTSDQDLNRKGRRVVPAPPPSNPRLYSTVLSVECAEDEEVEWCWTETAEGSFVSGYCLVPRVPNL